MRRVLTVFVCFGLCAVWAVGCARRAEETVGIIGGADGPTASFVALQIIQRLWPIFVVALVLAAVIFAIVYYKRKK